MKSTMQNELRLIRRLVLLGFFRLGLYAAEATLYCFKQVSRFLLHTFTALEGGLKTYTAICDYELWGSIPTTVEDPSKRCYEVEPMVDILAAIDGKQVLLVGETGSGKSTLAQWLAYSVGGRVTVYEPEGTPEDWMGLEVVGEGENWSAIEQAMWFDLNDLTSQVQLRKAKGDAALASSDRVLIAEEFPETVEKVDCAAEWLERHARRGRKARRFLILLSQSNRVKSWGLDGKGDLLNSFRIIRLGKFARDHARKLGSPELMAWLAQGQSRCLIDDEPLHLPSYQEMQHAAPRFLPSGVAVKTQESGSAEAAMSEANEANSSDSEESSRSAQILEALADGKSDYWIAKNLFGVKGGSRYQKVRKEIARIRALEGVAASS